MELHFIFTIYFTHVDCSENALKWLKPLGSFPVMYFCRSSVLLYGCFLTTWTHGNGYNLWCHWSVRLHVGIDPFNLDCHGAQTGDIITVLCGLGKCDPTVAVSGNSWFILYYIIVYTELTLAQVVDKLGQSSMYWINPLGHTKLIIWSTDVFSPKK